MTVTYGVLCVVGYVAGLFFAWALCRCKAQADAWEYRESPSEPDVSGVTSPSAAADAGGYRLARGCVRSVSDERPEDTIRRLRGDPQADA